jgi:hypothetical protein
LGFIPGITTDYSTMEFAGHESDAKLLGIFDVSILHNIVHLLFGIAGLAMARTWDSTRAYMIGGGPSTSSFASTACSLTSGSPVRCVLGCRWQRLLRIVMCTNVPQIALPTVCVTEDNARNRL